MDLATTIRSRQGRADWAESERRRRVIEDPDGELIARVANGDRTATRAIMARHLPKVLNLGRRMLGDAEEAEDVAQDVFIRVWTNAARWRPGQAKFETWIHRVAMNLCYDRLRRRPTSRLDDAPDVADQTPSAEVRVQEQQLAGVVDAALRELPDRQREAIVLYHYQGLTNIDAADVMGVSVEAMESLLSRGRRALKRRLLPLKNDMFGTKD